jgi:hypothetical protein
VQAQLSDKLIERFGSGSCVYFIHSGPFIKIGWTSSLRERLNSVRCGSPFAAYVAAVEPHRSKAAAKSAEFKYHTKYAACRYRGEWFHTHWRIVARMRKLHEEDFDSGALPAVVSRGWDLIGGMQ